MKKTLVVLLALGLSLPLLAQEIGSDPVFPPPERAVVADSQQDAAAVPKPKEVVAKFLELTADQVTQWDALLQKQLDAVKPLAEQVKANGEALRTLLEQPTPDPAAVGALVIKNKQLGDQIGTLHKEYVQGFEALLTTEQTTRLNSVRLANRLQPVLPAFHALGLLPRR